MCAQIEAVFSILCCSRVLGCGFPCLEFDVNTVWPISSLVTFLVMRKMPLWNIPHDFNILECFVACFIKLEECVLILNLLQMWVIQVVSIAWCTQSRTIKYSDTNLNLFSQMLVDIFKVFLFGWLVCCLVLFCFFLSACQDAMSLLTVWAV